MKSFRIIAVVLVLLIVFAFIARSQGWIGKESLLEVETEKIEPRTIVETVTASGKLYPETEIKINAEVSGEVISLQVAEGDSVKSGQLLVEINPDLVESDVLRMSASLDQARANLAGARSRKIQAQSQLTSAESSFERNNKLHNEKVISDADFETALASVESARAELMVAEENVNSAFYNVRSMEATLKQSRDNLKRTTISAPMDGIVTALNIKKGETVLGTIQMTGTEILRIADLNVMEVHVDVSENDVLRISEGDTAYIEVDAYLGRKFTGVVKQVASSARSDQLISAEQATNFEVQISLLKESYADLMPKNGEGRYPLFPGMSATAEIKTNVVRNTIAVPIQCVTTREDSTQRIEDEVREIIFVEQDGLALEKTVKTGIQDDNYIQLEGAEEGWKVITGPYKAISRELEDSLGVELKSKSTSSKKHGK